MPTISGDIRVLTPESGKETAVSLLIVSFLALFLELTLIRWLPANVLSLAYFSNIVLVSSFLGLGVGVIMSSHKRDLFRLFPWGLAVAAAVFLILKQYEIILPVGESEWIWSYYSGNKIDAPAASIGIFTALTLVYFLVAALFVAIGQKTGRLIHAFPSNAAYIVNIAGSLLGVIAFGLLSYVEGWPDSPLFWFTASGVLSLWFFRKEKRRLFVSTLAVVAIFFLIWSSSGDSVWSPYYSIQHKSLEDNSRLVFVNRFFHQKAVNFTSDEAARAKYDIPYRLKKPNNALILGAGTGNDVAVALLNGVEKIDAVEIDPVILNFGKLHPNRPYESPRVRAIVDDARSFLKKTENKYDLIILGTLDSHALLSGMSTVRLDNFVYTLESMKDVNGRLSSEGLAVLMFSAPNRWLTDKLLQLAYNSFDHPAFTVFQDNYLFNLMIFGGPGAADIVARGSENDLEISPIEQNMTIKDLPVDDWPYLYLAGRTIPVHYIKAALLLLAISFLAVATASRFQIKKGGGGINFFALGSAFLLLETKSVTTLSLLFGSTWLVNVFVFSGILSLILCANFLLLKREVQNINLFYVLLFISLAVNYFVKTNIFLESGFWFRSVIPAALAALPLFFASFIFAFHIKVEKWLGPALGVNLLGAVFGGFLEYSSMLIGLNNLYVVAAVLYFISFLAFKFSNHLTPPFLNSQNKTPAAA